MKRVAVIGGGNGGLATAAELALQGYDVRLFNRSSGPVEAIDDRGGVAVRGCLGDETVEIAAATTSLSHAVEGADVGVVVLPALAHDFVATALATTAPDLPLVLNPGHMCGSLHFRRIFERAGARPPPIAELGTLTSVCRSLAPGAVDVYVLARDVPLAAVPANDDLLKDALTLFPRATEVECPIEVWLWDVNMVLHPPGMVVGASRIESSAEPFRFYRDGITPSVESVLHALDEERRRVGREYGIELPDLGATMAALGTADAAAAERGTLGAAIRGGEANATILAPRSTDHRYLHEDIAYGLVPLLALARCAGVDIPVADSLVTLAGVINGRDYHEAGLNGERLGIAGYGVNDVRRMAMGVQ